MDEITGIFPTPILIGRAVVPGELVTELIEHFESETSGANVRSQLLSHTPMENPRNHESYRAVLGHVAPKIVKYGETLLGERLNWGVKEIWINKMETGGAQKMHNHANSFISGILYLTESHPSAATTFYRQVGAQGFQMQNENKNCRIGPYNSPIFRAPDVAPGDVILFPSYVLHEVPPNQGPPRLTAAFNALPERLDSWGYRIHFRG